MGSQSESRTALASANVPSDVERWIERMASITNIMQEEKFITKFFNCSNEEACQFLKAAKLLADKAVNLNGLRNNHHYLVSRQAG